MLLLLNDIIGFYEYNVINGKRKSSNVIYKMLVKFYTLSVIVGCEVQTPRFNKYVQI